jgi:hypothetical protein
MYPDLETARNRIAELHHQAQLADLAIAIRRARRARQDRSGHARPARLARADRREVHPGVWLAERGEPVREVLNRFPGRDAAGEVVEACCRFGARRVEAQPELRTAVGVAHHNAHQRALLDELATLGPLRAEAVGLTAQHAQAAALQAELRQLQRQRDALAAAIGEVERLTLALAQLRAEHADLSTQVVETREIAILQEAGVYKYRHPLQDAIAY